jgi:hypothetical protein
MKGRDLMPDDPVIMEHVGCVPQAERQANALTEIRKP